MLSTGLLIGSGAGAIATADPAETSGGAATGSQGTGAQGSQGAGATGVAEDKKPETRTTTTVDSDDDTIGGTAPTSTVSAQTNESEGDEDGTDSMASTTDEDVAETTAPTSASNTPTSVSSAPTSASTAPASATNDPAALSSAPAPGTNAAVPASTPPTTPATVSKVVIEPVTNAVVSVARALGTSAATFATLPSSETPVTDVVTSIQEVLSSVAGAGATLTQVSSDFYTLLGVSQPVQPSLIGTGGAFTGAPPAANEAAPLFGPVASQLPLLPPAGGDAPLFGTVVHASTVGGVAASGLNHQLTLSGLAPLAPAGVNGGAGSFFDHVINAVLVPASLTALAAIAIPGAGGLLIVIGAGVRFGYRQAKAAFIMRTSGIARFAGPGPLGVVRSGSLVALHTRTHDDRPKSAPGAHRKPARSARHLERVA